MSMMSADLTSVPEMTRSSDQAAGERRLNDLRRLSWPSAKLGEGLQQLCVHSGLGGGPRVTLSLPADVAREGGENLIRWVSWAADQLGVDAEPVQTDVAGVSTFLKQGGPAVLPFLDLDGPRFLLLLAPRGGRPRLLGPDLKVARCNLDDLRDLLVAPMMRPAMQEAQALVAMAGIEGKSREKVIRQLAEERGKSLPVYGLHMLRMSATAPFLSQVLGVGLLPRVVGLIGISVLIYVLEILAWLLVGEAALSGRLDFGWLIAFVLTVLTTIPFRSFATWINNRAFLMLSQLLKARLLSGALRIDTDELRKAGTGHLLASIMDSQAFESLSIGGGFTMLLAVVELLFSVWILSKGAAGLIEAGLLVSWTALAVYFGRQHFKSLQSWTQDRSRMTQSLLERMLGHRTILVQDRAHHRQMRDDSELHSYLSASRHVDRSAMPLLILIPGVWAIIGLAGLVPSFVAGDGTSVGFAISVGGIIFAGRALGGLVTAMIMAANAGVAWNRVKPLFDAGACKPSSAPFVPLDRSTASEVPARLFDAEDLSFSYPGRPNPILRDVAFTIEKGDRILLQGESGGGKSTLTSLLTGLRKPTSGLLMLAGLDHQTLGEAWHDFATKAPQFHENHIMTGTLAFNLLMGRNWPATEEDLQLARDVCVELDLGDLLDRMPAGIHQVVGETGWQLSHGERSRIFLARAILQDAPLTILDESFAALDPETLQNCIDCAFQRSNTLIVVAHP